MCVCVCVCVCGCVCVFTDARSRNGMCIKIYLCHIIKSFMLQFLFAVTDYILAAVMSTTTHSSITYHTISKFNTLRCCAEIYSFSYIVSMQDYIVINTCKRNSDTTFETYLWMKNQLIWRGIKGPNGHRLHMHANHKYNQTRLDYLVLKSAIKSIPRIRFWSNSALKPPEMTCMSSHGWKITETSHLNQTDDCPVTFKFLFRKVCFSPTVGSAASSGGGAR